MMDEIKLTFTNSSHFARTTFGMIFVFMLGVRPDVKTMLMLAALLYGCGQLNPFQSGGGGPERKANPCDANAQGPDNDGDGLTNDCEALLGTDPNKKDSGGKGIDDGANMPPAGADPDAEEAFKKSFLERHPEIAEALMVANAAFSGNPVPGFAIDVSKIIPRLRIAYQGMAKEPKNMCGDDVGSYLWLNVGGTFARCKSQMDDTKTPECDDPIPTELALCSKLENPSPAPDKLKNSSDTLVLSDFTWSKGIVVGSESKFTVFNPEILHTGDKAAKTNVEIKVSSASGGRANRIRVTWEAVFQAQGYARNKDEENTAINLSPQNVSKKWQRLNEPKTESYFGIVGIFEED